MLSKKTKEGILPSIKDWTRHYTGLRNANPNELSFNLWFWFSPIAYRIVTYGLNILGMILFGIVSFLFDNMFIQAVALAFVVFNGYQFGKKLSAKKPKDYNFYDLYMREYIQK